MRIDMEVSDLFTYTENGLNKIYCLLSPFLGASLSMRRATYVCVFW